MLHVWVQVIEFTLWEDVRANILVAFEFVITQFSFEQAYNVWIPVTMIENVSYYVRKWRFLTCHIADFVLLWIIFYDPIKEQWLKWCLFLHGNVLYEDIRVFPS